MINLKQQLIDSLKPIVIELYPTCDVNQVVVQETKTEFEGDFTLVCFPFTKHSKQSPQATAQTIGEKLISSNATVSKFNVVNGFLNIGLTNQTWLNYLLQLSQHSTALVEKSSTRQKIVVEYSSPNTNKPLHLGHIRNNLLGISVSNILKAVGHEVVMVNLVNDRGIHICKSMVAWKKAGMKETPENTGLKGDHLVGKYYVAFDQNYKAEIAQLISEGKTEEEAKKVAPSILEAQEMLRKWEAGDEETKAIWKKMNGWVYDGFEITYKRLGVSFDRFYYESETYLLGKNIVNEGLQKGVFYQKDDNSVWIDLRPDGLDEKVLLRSDGTSVYMTQDLGTALERAKEWQAERYIYVVGNEQDYHFKVLQKSLQKMGYAWADGIYHLSYGMVDLPSGKMKSREGTVVDADDLMDEVVQIAREKGEELGKTDLLNDSEKNLLYEQIGMGALKYFILKVDAKKRIVFNPAESIDLNGHTGPFIQYTYTRIQSIFRKGGIADAPLNIDGLNVENIHLDLLKKINAYSETVNAAAEQLNPAAIANYCFELAQLFNRFYHDYSILKEENWDVRNYRLQLCQNIGQILKNGMNLLGIDLPEKM
jgi:arginyl-tRNA synthetase